MFSVTRHSSARSFPRAIAWGACLLSAGAARAHPEIEQALVRLNAAITASPANPAHYLTRGELYAKHEAWDLAEANLLLAAELAPDFPGLARARGSLALALRQPRAARDFLDAALAHDPRDATALVLRARAHVALGARSAAVTDLDAALTTIATPSPELFLERAALLPPAEALRGLETAITRVGPAIPLQLRAVSLEESLGRIDAAAARLTAIAAQSERPEMWLKRRGDLLVRARRLPEAHAAYAAALAAIGALPDWLRAAPGTAELAAELQQLTALRS